MKIFEYKPNLGTLSLGLERFPQNEVVEVAHLSKIAAYSYNNTHKQWFLPDFKPISDYETEKDYDLAILYPNIGNFIARQGKSNFTEADLFDCLRFLEYEHPKFAVIVVNNHAIPLLNHAKDYVRDGFGQISKDIVIANLQSLGYKAHLIAVDEANYGIPTHKHIAMYIATPNDFDFKFPKGLFTRFGRGKHPKFRTIADAIGDLGAMSEWSPYATDPQNAYQRNLRRSMPKVTWHFIKRKISAAQIEAIKKILPGTNAKKTQNVKQKSGYNRPKWDRICPTLDDRFYMVSSRSASIHPLKNRPFTMREGMRIMGLPDNISFELTSSTRDIAPMIVESIAPAMGELVALSLGAIK